MRFTLMTFNLRYPYGDSNSWQTRKEAVINFLNEVKPEIIGTQEVFEFMKEDITNQLPFYNCFGIPRSDDLEAVVIFYKKDLFEIVNSGNFWLSETPNKFGSKSWLSSYVRMCTWVELIFKNDRSKKIRVFNTHLDNESEEARIKGFNVILDKINELNEKEDLLTFITGDLNDFPSSKTIFLINKLIDNKKLNLKHPYLKDINYGVTFHDFGLEKHGEPIDYIYFPKEIDWTNFKIHNNNKLSDHYPVSISFKL